jgi:3-oxoacyl-[acyl-carrier protein] reductase
LAETAKAFGRLDILVNNAGIYEFRARADISAYSATKGAVEAITGVPAKELGPRRIRVNAILPGVVLTEGVRAGGFDAGDLRKEMEARTPLGRIGRPEDMAPAVVFLAAEDSAWITGESLLVAGGLR